MTTNWARQVPAYRHDAGHADADPQGRVEGVVTFRESLAGVGGVDNAAHGFPDQHEAGTRHEQAVHQAEHARYGVLRGGDAGGAEHRWEYPVYPLQAEVAGRHVTGQGADELAEAAEALGRCSLRPCRGRQQQA